MSDDNDYVTDFISAAVADKPVAATKAFSQAIEPKIDAALAAAREEILQQTFNRNIDTEENEDV